MARHGQTRPDPSVFDQEAPNLEGLPLERLELQENGLSNVSGLEGAEIQELLLQDSHGQPWTDRNVHVSRVS